jgi:hypothetical protein
MLNKTSVFLFSILTTASLSILANGGGADGAGKGCSAVDINAARQAWEKLPICSKQDTADHNPQYVTSCREASASFKSACNSGGGSGGVNTKVPKDILSPDCGGGPVEAGIVWVGARLSAARVDVVYSAYSQCISPSAGQPPELLNASDIISKIACHRCVPMPVPVNPVVAFSCGNGTPSFSNEVTTAGRSALTTITCTSAVTGKDVNTAGRYFWDLVFSCTKTVSGDNTAANGTFPYAGATVACGDKNKFTNGDEKGPDIDTLLTDTTLNTSTGNAAGLNNNIATRTGVSACNTGCASLVALSDGSFGVSSSCVNSAKTGALR